MGYDASKREAVLKRILEISGQQKALLDENRLEDILRCQRERDALMAELPSGPNYKEESLKSLIEGIIAIDSFLILRIEASIGDLKGKLARVVKGAIAVKAYNRARK